MLLARDGEGLKLCGQWSDEFQPKTKAVSRSNDGRQTRWRRHVELNFEQIARIQQDACVENHAALAQLSSAAFDHSRREAFGGNDANGHIDGQTIPAARVGGGLHD